MNKDQKPYNITYTFHVQSVEDFYRQLNNQADIHMQTYECDVDDVALAQSMLRSIGVNV